MPAVPVSPPWYAAGLAFRCQACGDCCRGPGGYVWVDPGEIDPLAGALGLDRDKFIERFIRQTPSGIALVDGPGGDCPFLDAGNRCRTYAVRPMQCRTWPWWRENIIAPENWAGAARRCPGIDKGEAHSRFHIEAESAKDF